MHCQMAFLCFVLVAISSIAISAPTDQTSYSSCTAPSATTVTTTETKVITITELEKSAVAPSVRSNLSTITVTSYSTIFRTETTYLSHMLSGRATSSPTPSSPFDTCTDALRTVKPSHSSAESIVYDTLSLKPNLTSTMPSHHAPATQPGPTPSICGESGNFTLGWDDEPSFTPTTGSGTVFPPVFNPYHHLFFSNGYVYAPQPQEPYQAVSKPNVALFLPNGTTQDIGSPSAAGQRPGELGAGPRAGLNQYWFNVYGGFFGCDNAGPGACQLNIKGFFWSKSTQQEVEAVEESFAIPPCVGLRDCKLTYLRLTRPFRGLSGLQMRAEVNGSQEVFFLDNLQMGWYNSSCAAGLERLSAN